MRPGRRLRARARRSTAAGRRRRRSRSATTSATGRRRGRGSSRRSPRPPARCRCRRTSTSRSPTPSATRPSTPAGRARPRRRRPGSTSPTAVLDRLRGRGRRRGHASSWPSGSTRSGRSPSTAVEDHAMHTEALRGAGGDARGASRDRAAGRVVAVGTTVVRALESAAATGRAGRAAPTCSSTPGYRVPGRRPAAHQLPRAPLDAARAGRRLRRPPVARPLRRRPSPRATASCPSATPCCSTEARPVSLTRPASTPSTATARADDGHDRRGARSARRASCRSAPGARCEPSTPPTSRRSAPRSCSATPTT